MLDRVSVSEVAMDAVSVSDIALDAIWASQVGWDAVKTKSMAVGKFAVGRAGLDGADYADIDAVAGSQTAMDAVSTSQTAMDAVSTSQTAMDAVSSSTVAMDAVAVSQLAMDAVIASDDIALPTVVESATAMDAVSTSDTALDSIWQSQLAFDTVKTKAMAIGKFVAGRAGLDGANYADIDAVVASQTAMDAVAGSQTAMDAVAASTMAYSATFESDFSIDSLWASTPGAETILTNSGSETLPHNYSTFTARIEDGSGVSLPGSTKAALEYDVDDQNHAEDYAGWSLQVDLSNASTLEFKNRADNTPNSSTTHGVQIDGNTVVENGGNFGWTTRSVDVSGYNGTHEVKFFHMDGNYTGTWEAYFADLNLV